MEGVEGTDKLEAVFEKLRSDNASSASFLLWFSSQWNEPWFSAMLSQWKSLQPSLRELRIGLVYVSSDFEGSKTAPEFGIPAHILNGDNICAALMNRFHVKSLPSAVLVTLDGNPLRDFCSAKQYLSDNGVQFTHPKSMEVLQRCVDGNLSHVEIGEPSASEAEKKTQREEAIQFFEQGDFFRSAIVFSRILAVDPTCSLSNYNMGVILQTMGHNRLAVDHMLKVVSVSPEDSTAHTILRTVLYPSEPYLVVEGYEAIVRKDPANVRAVHTLCTLTKKGKTAEKEYVRQVFDELAETFEDKLVHHLEYKIPWQLLEAVKRTMGEERIGRNSLNVVDLGCGTGLCGSLFKPYSKHLVGVDLSPLMIEKAKATALYDDLRVQDVFDTVHSLRSESVDLILSADVWIYVGELDSIFEMCRSKLAPCGLLAFSIELLQTESIAKHEDGRSCVEFQLAHSGRFQHTTEYITRLAAQNRLRIAVEQRVIVRKESNEPIHGCVYVLQVFN